MSSSSGYVHKPYYSTPESVNWGNIPVFFGLVLGAYAFLLGGTREHSE